MLAALNLNSFTEHLKASEQSAHTYIHSAVFGQVFWISVPPDTDPDFNSNFNPKHM